MSALLGTWRNGLVLTLLSILWIQQASSDCVNPDYLRANWFSLERGDDVSTLINPTLFSNHFFEGTCHERWDDNSTLDADGNHDSKILYKGSKSGCYKCYHMFFRTINIVEYKQTECYDRENPTLDEICNNIREDTEVWTFFRMEVEKVNCKNTFEGIFQFSYEWDKGGGGICDSPDSTIVACQEPGSPYVDNEVFVMNFAKCPEVQSSENQEIRFQCMGTWEDDEGNVWSAVSDLGEDVYRERFRCLLTRYDQEEEDNKMRYSMSWYAQCSTLNSPYEGPTRLLLQPQVGDFQLVYAAPQCNFPTNFSGSWFHTSEYDVQVQINATHIYFRTQYDLYRYKETYFVCMMHSGTRYMTVAVTVGKCEIDFVCWDMLPRHHSIIRWRLSRPYRLTEIELAYPDTYMYMFRQACSWNSFTIDRNNVAWNYKTFLLNPPVPMQCPIRGRYSFTQRGQESELFKTRIRGITVRPRHMIDCQQYVSEIKSCDQTPSMLSIDAEYCETVDHTGRPIGEYDMADWELTCIGHWDEDWASYMITWDTEDAMSPFRCWTYKRTDWRHIVLARATDAACLPTLTPYTYDPELGGSLALVLEETERQYDDCAMNYAAGDPAQSDVDMTVYELNSATACYRVTPNQVAMLLLCLVNLIFLSL